MFGIGITKPMKLSGLRRNVGLDDNNGKLCWGPSLYAFMINTKESNKILIKLFEGQLYLHTYFIYLRTR